MINCSQSVWKRSIEIPPGRKGEEGQKESQEAQA